jgi:hypothetical protein
MFRSALPRAATASASPFRKEADCERHERNTIAPEIETEKPECQTVKDLGEGVPESHS